MYLAIIASCSVPLTLLMTTSYPEFSPTLSEEEKLNDRKKHSFNLSNQIKDLMKDKNFLLITSSSAIIVVANEINHKILSILYFQIYDEPILNELYLRETYEICTCVGLLTFGIALFGRLNLKMGFKFTVYICSLSNFHTSITQSYYLVFFLQVLAEFSRNN
jgi:hypothetical protein